MLLRTRTGIEEDWVVIVKQEELRESSVRRQERFMCSSHVLLFCCLLPWLSNMDPSVCLLPTLTSFIFL